MRMRGLAALCGLMFLAGCSSVDISAPIEDRSTPSPEVSVPVESTEAHSVPVPSEGTFQPRHLTTEPTPQASGRTHVVVQGVLKRHNRLPSAKLLKKNSNARLPREATLKFVGLLKAK